MELFSDSFNYIVSLFSTSVVPCITAIIFVLSLIFLVFAKIMKKRWPDTLSDSNSKIKRIKLVLMISSVMLAVFIIYFTITIIVLSLGIINM